MITILLPFPVLRQLQLNKRKKVNNVLRERFLHNAMDDILTPA